MKQSPDQMDTAGVKALKMIAKMTGFYSRKNVRHQSYAFTRLKILLVFSFS